MTRIRNTVALLRGQLWIVPALMTVGAVGLAWLLLVYGAGLLQAGGHAWWLYAGDANTARDLLAGLLSGLMTMASLTVSVTFVILTLAASQLGPRLIVMFMADRQIQAVIGGFLGTILYVIIILRTLDDSLGPDGVPHVAVSAASALTILCLFALLFYIHKIARAIIADTVVAAVAKGLRADLRGILPDEAPPEPSGHTAPGPFASLALGRSGYVQIVDYDALLALAGREDLVIDVRVRAGHFVLRSGDHVRLHGVGTVEPRVGAAVREAFVVADERTAAQDLEHGIRQLVEIGLRALSPGVNDPFTAIAVIDRLADAFEEILRRPLPRRHLADRGGVIRVLADRSDARGLLNAAFDPLRQAGAGSPAVLIRLADVLGLLAPVLESPEAREAVLEHLDKLVQTTRLGSLAPCDARDTLARIEGARIAVRGAPTPDGRTAGPADGPSDRGRAHP